MAYVLDGVQGEEGVPPKAARQYQAEESFATRHESEDWGFEAGQHPENPKKDESSSVPLVI